MGAGSEGVREWDRKGWKANVRTFLIWTALWVLGLIPIEDLLKNLSECPWLVTLKDKRLGHLSRFPAPSRWSDAEGIIPPQIWEALWRITTPGFRESPEGGKPKDTGCPGDGTLSSVPRSWPSQEQLKPEVGQRAYHQAPEAFVTALIYCHTRFILSMKQFFNVTTFFQTLQSLSTVSSGKPKFLGQNIKGINIPDDFLPKGPFSSLIHTHELCALNRTVSGPPDAFFMLSFTSLERSSYILPVFPKLAQIPPMHQAFTQHCLHRSLHSLGTSPSFVTCVSSFFPTKFILLLKTVILLLTTFLSPTISMIVHSYVLY